ncbi:hypothetical protein KGQ55_02415 [Patescibacteria group bacterium]|nr:hypothetical protein [Patescibacteria group bacterium]
MKKTAKLKYGENQRLSGAVRYETDTKNPLALSKWNWHGMSMREVSKISLTDLSRGVRTATQIAATFEKNFKKVPYIAVGMKHGNPCGAAVGKTPAEAMKGMIAGNPRALFGGFVVTTFPVDAKLADILRRYDGTRMGAPRPIAFLAAPAISPEALAALHRKSRPLIYATNPALAALRAAMLPSTPRHEPLPILSAEIVEDADTYVLDLAHPELAVYGKKAAWKKALPDIALAAAVAATSTSNTVTLAKGGKIVGNAIGQQDRVGACELALKQLSRLELPSRKGLVAASDSFFPMPDGPATLRKGGVEALLATSGAQNDAKVIEYCTSGKTPLLLALIPDRVGRGFYGHTG